MGRLDIPSRIKREVRQRCGHGCVMCGNPLYQYDHLIDWAETHRHVAEEITLLCHEHHGKKTLKLLSRDQVQKANAVPHNIASGVTSPFGLDFSPADEVEMIVGGDSFTSTSDLFPIVVDNIPLLGFIRTEEGLALHVHLRDRFNLPLLSVANNELMMVTEVWDIEFVGQELILRQAARNILMRMRFEPPSRVVIMRARIMCNGVLIDVNKDEITGNNLPLRLEHNWWRTSVGLTIGECPDYPTHKLLHWNVDRYTPELRQNGG